MRDYTLTHLSDALLLRELSVLVTHDRATTARMLAHLAEVDVRRLYAPAGYSSLFAYCVEELRMSEDAASKRIQAARAARLFPILFTAVAEGRLHLSAVCLLAPHLTPENVDEWIESASHRRKAEIEMHLARRFPSPAVPPMVRPLSARSFQHAPGHVDSLSIPTRAILGAGHDPQGYAREDPLRPVASQPCGSYRRPGSIDRSCLRCAHRPDRKAEGWGWHAASCCPRRRVLAARASA